MNDVSQSVYAEDFASGQFAIWSAVCTPCRLINLFLSVCLGFVLFQLTAFYRPYVGY